MRKECPMAKRTAKRARRKFTPEFKAEVRLCKVGDRSVRQVALDLDLTETALREWVKRADEEGAITSSDAITSNCRRSLPRADKRRSLAITRLRGHAVEAVTPSRTTTIASTA